MEKLMLIAAVALCVTGVAQAQQQKKVEAPVAVSTAAPVMAMPGKVAVVKSTATVKDAKALPANKGKNAAKAVEYKVKATEYGTKAVCPVTGEALTVDAKTTAAKYKGKVYYFCCPACLPSFKEDPAKYVK